MNIDSTNLNQLPALAALLDERHVSRAADRVKVSQPTMSRILQQLRRQFGDELLIRGPAGYSLTPRAERVRAQLATALASVEGIFDAGPYDPSTGEEVFRVAVSDYTFSQVGPAITHAILSQSPSSTVSCEVVDANTFDKLDTGSVDLAIYGPVPPDRYRRQLLFTDRYVCVVGSDHPLAQRDSMTLTEYLRLPHVAIELGHPGVDRIAQALGAVRRIAVRLPYHVLAASLLPGTDLILTVPAGLVPLLANSTSTHTLAAPTELDELDFYAAWHPRYDNDPAHRWLREVVSAAAGVTSNALT